MLLHVERDHVLPHVSGELSVRAENHVLWLRICNLFEPKMKRNRRSCGSFTLEVGERYAYRLFEKCQYYVISLLDVREI